MSIREEILMQAGANQTIIAELLAYTRNAFDHASKKALLEDEPFVADWAEYLHAIEQGDGVFAVLKQHLVQLAFPIQAGISQTDAYKAVTLRGVPVDNFPTASGLILEHPESLELCLHPTLAGHIPVLIVRHRPDFVVLVQAFSCRNEPVPVPDSKGAGIVTGYNNWSRIRKLRRQWEQTRSDPNEFSWQREFKNIMMQKELYQDRFILLSDSYYSAVQPHALGLEAEDWRQKSLILRREHECIHYLTERLFNSMQNNLMDELIADYMGIVAANGCFCAQWFLHFMGLENYPQYREGARLQNYRNNLSDEALEIVKYLMKNAAENIEAFTYEGDPVTLALALTYLTLEELASPQSHELLSAALEKARRLMEPPSFA